MSTEPAQPVRIDARGDDIDEAIELFQDGYNGTTFAVERSQLPFFFRHTAVGDSRMTLRTSRFDGHVTGLIAPGDDYVVSWLTAGRGHFDVGRDDILLELGQPMVFTTDRPFAFDFEDVRQQLVHFDRSALERIVADYRGHEVMPLHLDHSVPPAPDAVRAWRNTIALVSRTVRDDTASPILQAEMTRIAAIAFLGMFPPRRVEVSPAMALPKNAHLRDAVEFMHANAHLPITTTTIAASSGLSIRALQEGFRRHFDTTPNAYLRGVRLDRAHRDLLESGPGSVTVIARRWGFANAGRFSAAYVERFGELPRTTGGRSADV